MSVELSNVPGRVEPEGYVHVGVASGSRTVYLAGQVSQDADGATVAVGVNPIKAATLIGVAALFEPGLLVEIEATAVLA